MSINNLGFILFFFLNACVSVSYFESKQAAKADQQFSNLLLTDVLAAMKNNFPPAKTKLLYNHSGEALSKAIELELRKAGYALAAGEKKDEDGQIQFAYLFDQLDQKKFLLRFVAGENFQATRVYQTTEDGNVKAVGPLLIRRAEQ
ncbi:MAG: hypothetical protein EOP04_31020 [Proteobacteria bacterium]|nr:MAG: hypothetical protein EOP04_31020 [Pseudomonadota bacterium]